MCSFSPPAWDCLPCVWIKLKLIKSMVRHHTCSFPSDHKWPEDLKRRIHASELKGLISFKQTVSLNSSSLWPKSEERTELQTNTCNQSQSNPHFILTQSHLAIISSNDCPGFAGTLNHPGPPSSLPGNWPAHKHSDSNVQLHSEFKTVALNVRQPLILTNTVVS